MILTYYKPTLLISIFYLSLSAQAYTQQEESPLTIREKLDQVVKSKRAKHASLDSINQIIAKFRREERSIDRKKERASKAVKKLQDKLEKIQAEIDELKAESHSIVFKEADDLAMALNEATTLQQEYNVIEAERIELDKIISANRRKNEEFNMMVDTLNKELLGLESVDNLKIDLSTYGSVLLRSSYGKARFNLHSISLEGIQPYPYVHKRTVRCDIKTNYWAFDIECSGSDDQKNCIIEKDGSYVRKLEGVKFFTKEGAHRCIEFLQKLKRNCKIQ